MTPPIRIRWTERARLDLFDIADCIAVRNPAAAVSFADGLIRSVVALSENTLAGRIVPETSRADIREILHGRYRIVYRIQKTELHILTVFEGHKSLAFDHPPEA